MIYAKKVLKAWILFIAITVCTLFFGAVPLTAMADEDCLYLGGFPAGFVLNTTNVEVIGLCDVMTDSGIRSPAREAGIKTGDVICSINGEEVKKTSDVNELIGRDFKLYEVTVRRGGDSIKFNVDPAKDVSSGGKRIGVLVKDSVNGIGTVTYIDKVNNKFASLGHPVTDGDGKLIGINGGTVYGSLIYDVKKGVRGAPGELKGAFENSTVIGKAAINCPCGVYGELAENFDCSKLVKISKATMDEVTIGPAQIYSTVYGKEARKFDISIVKIDKTNKDNRNFVIKIEDKNLIDKTGGIVQGMSGSPIVQNGKLIGAVTHVFVNDPTRGYGIAIDKMLDSY